MHDDGDDGEDTTIMINMLVAICNFFTCVCVRTCVGTCVRTPPMPPDLPHPPAPSPELQEAQNTKIQ